MILELAGEQKFSNNSQACKLSRVKNLKYIGS